MAEGLAATYDAHSLDVLNNYNEAMLNNIKYFEEFEKKDMMNERRLLHVFDKLISPLTRCVLKALRNGLSIDNARSALRPIVDDLEVMLLVEEGIVEGGLTDSEWDELHQKFWRGLLRIPTKFADYLGGEKDQKYLKVDKKICVDMASDYAKHPQSSDPKIAYPDIRDHKNSPALYVAALHFMAFLADSDTALRILQKVENRPSFQQDYSFLWLAAKLSYFQGKPVDVGDSYFRYLEQWRNTARQRQSTIASSKRQCAIVKCADEFRTLIGQLGRRERRAELLAMNGSAYFVAEDLARGIRSAVSYEAIVKEYAEEIRLAVKKKGFPDEKNNFLDTYAYVTMVIEARRANPSRDKFKKMAEILENVVQTMEKEQRGQEVINKLDLNELKIVRAHLASARELAGE